MKRTAADPVAPIPGSLALHVIAAVLGGVDIFSSVESVQNTVPESGQSQALRSAEATRQDAGQVVDTIVAEDIGKFPDNNVAELLGRMGKVARAGTAYMLRSRHLWTRPQQLYPC